MISKNFDTQLLKLKKLIQLLSFIFHYILRSLWTHLKVVILAVTRHIHYWFVKREEHFLNFSINVMTFHKWFKTTYTVCSNKFCLLKDRKLSRKFKFDWTNFFLVQNLLGHPVAHKIGKIKNNKTWYQSWKVVSMPLRSSRSGGLVIMHDDIFNLIIIFNKVGQKRFGNGLFPSH